jgi:hypothetical protein
MPDSSQPVDELPLIDLLRALVAEIAAGGYRDRLGHQLTHNTAYLQAVAVLAIDDTLAGDAERPARLGG